jgi:hypothetical protein
MEHLRIQSHNPTGDYPRLNRGCHDWAELINLENNPDDYLEDLNPITDVDLYLAHLHYLVKWPGPQKVWWRRRRPMRALAIEKSIRNRIA